MLFVTIYILLLYIIISKIIIKVLAKEKKS